MKKIVFKTIKIMLVIIVILFFLNTYVIININVPTGSMENTIQVNDKLIGNRFIYKISEIDRYDIVIAEDPFIKNRMIVKRVVGLSGEKIEIHDGAVYVNGSREPIQESYLKEEWIENDGDYVFEIPDNHYLLLGDNRNNSFDARLWLQQVETKKTSSLEQIYVDKEQIIAKVVFRYSPEFKILS